MVDHYPYLLDPKLYPDFRRRHVPVPTWETFQHTTQFTTLRDLSQTDWKDDLDRHVEEFNLGKVIWPLIHLLWSPHVGEVIEEIKKRGYYLFDLWSHVPGSPMEGIWSNITPPEGMVSHLQRTLGDRFLGIDNGEQDGRYVWSNGEQQCPSSPDRRRQYLNFQRHFQKLGEELGNHMTALTSLCFGHYFLKEGNHILLGAETAQALPCSQIYYSFIRGAGRQYGIHWFGNASVFNRWSWKDYGTEKREGHYVSGPERGTSLNLLKRLMYTHYLYNSVAVGFELNWLIESEDGSSHELSPIGRIQRDAVQFVADHGQPGTMHTPIAVLLDFFAGWAPPRHLYTRKVYQVWGGTPYDAGDYLAHGVLSALYPGYEDASFYHDERGFLTETPFGDMADCVLSDIPAGVLSQFGVVIAAGRLRMTVELVDKLNGFVEDGGHLIVTGENASALLPELMVLPDAVRIAPGSVVEWGDGSLQTEGAGFALLRASVPTSGAEVIATCVGLPVVVLLHRGEGRITVDLTPYGMGAGDGTETVIPEAVDDTPLPCPFPLLDHFTYLLKRILDEQRVFSVGEHLGYVTCRKSKGSYTVGIHNNTLGSLPFAITSHCGEIVSIEELSSGGDERESVGYWPMEYTGNDGGSDDASNIAGGQMRLFAVEIDEAQLRCKPALAMPKPHGNWLVSMPRGGRMQTEILQCPTFSQNYSGLKIEWDYLLEADKQQLERESAWLRRQKTDIVVDFSSGLNFYPDLTLLNSFPPYFNDSAAKMEDVFDKMIMLGASKAIITLHRKPDNHWGRERTEEEFVLQVGRLCDAASKRGISILLQPHATRWVDTTARANEFLDAVGHENLRIALNTGHLLIAGEDPGAAVATAGTRLGAVLFSSPTRDRYGQWYDSHSPFSGDHIPKSVFGDPADRDDVLFILDGDYLDIDSAYPSLVAARQTLARSKEEL
jgi:hypothetical protein